MQPPPSIHRRLRWLACSSALVVSVVCALGQSVAPETKNPAQIDPDPEKTIVLSPFVVTEDRGAGYESLQTTSGTRTVQALKNVANSISIANAQLIQDTGALTIEEISKWFVTGEANPDPANIVGTSRQIFRGIQSNYSIRNGWIWYSPMDSYSTERVEILRGPNAFLYGEGDLGGGQNQVTKRGLFNRDFARIKLTGGSYELLRGEFDINRRIGDKVAVRLAGVESHNETWWDHGYRDFSALYGAVTYRPFKNTTIHVLGEMAQTNMTLSQGLFVDSFSLTASPTVYTNANGVAYIPATEATYRLAGRSVSRGLVVGIVDPTVVPKEAQFNGPNAAYRPRNRTITFEVEQRIGKNLALQLSGNYYYQKWDQWLASAKTIFRDLNATLPNGAPNPYFNELYTEYYRQHQIAANYVRDFRLSAVYDWNVTSWMNQQIVLNVQQHQDNPGAKFPKMGEYVSPTNPSFLGTINTAATVAGFTANRATFTNNRFMRRYYLKDGDGADLTGRMDPVSGVSAFFPDFAALAATGAQTNSRFYTPSAGIGAAGSYFKGHLYTMIGYRKDVFKIKTTSGVPEPVADTWKVVEITDPFSEPKYARYEFDGKNYGAVLRFNDMIAVSANYAKSYRLSVGDGLDGYIAGTKQGIGFGEGKDIGLRLTFFGGKLELNSTYYNNYQPNARITPLGTAQQNIKNELAAIFPTTFNVNGADLQKTTTSGVETEVVANLTPGWRVMFNIATNKVVTEDRLVQLKSFQAQARELNQPTPLLDAFLPTFPEGVPNSGYTKLRVNFFTRYQFNRGVLKGAYIGGGANMRDRTYRGNAVVSGVSTPFYSPSYTVVTLLAGYQTKLFKHSTTFALNVDNLLDKEYYTSAALASGSWGAPRNFRLSATVDF